MGGFKERPILEGHLDPVKFHHATFQGISVQLDGANAPGMGIHHSQAALEALVKVEILLLKVLGSKEYTLAPKNAMNLGHISFRGKRE
jgi:hypothetical protein